MKFGEYYYQNQIPEWTSCYVPYISLKRRVKDIVLEAHQSDRKACFDELYSDIEHSAKVFGDFDDTIQHFLRGQHAAIGQHCIADDKHCLKGYIELLKDAEKLLQFDRLNEEAIRRVYKKVARYNRFYGIKDEHKPALKLNREKRILVIIDEMEIFAACIAKCLLYGPPDKGYLLKIAENYPTEYAESVCLAVEHEDVDALADLLGEQAANGGVWETRFQDLLSSLLSLSVSRHARKSIDVLLQRMTVYNHMIEDGFLHQILALAGRLPIKLEVTGLEVLDQSNQHEVQATTSTEFFTHVLDRIGPNKVAALLTKDLLGRLPLHYAALYGFTAICEIVLQTCGSWSADLCARSIMMEDNKRYTPLHYAVISNHVAIAKLFASTLEARHRRSKPADSREVAGIIKDLLCIALRYQYDEMVAVLATCHIGACRYPDNDETALYVAARTGRADYINILIQNGRAEDVHHRESINLWTPLFMTCAKGYLAASEALIKAGAWQGLHDRDGWTAREHAVARGHVAIARILTTYKSEFLMGGPATMPLKPRTRPHFEPLPGHDSSYLIVNPGVIQEGKIDNFLVVPAENQMLYKDGFELDVFCTKERRLYRLSMSFLDDYTHTRLVYSVPESSTSNIRLCFCLYRAKRKHTLANIVGCGAINLGVEANRLGENRESVLQVCSVPILNLAGSDVRATVNFTFVIAKPFMFSDLPSDSRPYGARHTTIVGRTGLGPKDVGRRHLQTGDEIIESCIESAKLGASFCQIGVQLTRDHAPVIYSELCLRALGLEVPMPHLSLGEVILGSTSTGASWSGQCVQGPSATLEELLVRLPEEVGLNIEIKYPSPHQAKNANVSSMAVEINKFIDTILDKIFKYAGSRAIILSSPTPEACILLSTKQQVYSVMFIASGVTNPIGDKDTRSRNLDGAIRFAKYWRLAGIFVPSEILALCPRFIQYIRRLGLTCGSYGPLNNDPDNVNKQAERCIDLVMTDCVELIVKNLRRNIPGQPSDD